MNSSGYLPFFVGGLIESGSGLYGLPNHPNWPHKDVIFTSLSDLHGPLDPYTSPMNARGPFLKNLYSIKI